MEIRRAGELDEGLIAAVRRLTPQLNPDAPEPSTAHLARLIAAEATELYLALDDEGEIVGMLTLAHYPLPTGERVWIEDVVVDASARGAGAGAALVHAAVARARELGAWRIDLTSRPEREAANRLYQRLGFHRRDTNAYRMTLDRSP